MPRRPSRQPKGPALQHILFEPPALWQATPVHELPSWSGATRVGIDVETRDPDLRERGPGVRRPGNYVAGVSFAIEDGPRHYLPMRHLGGGNLDPSTVLEYLRDQAKSYRGDICGANLSYDLDWLAGEGVVFNPRFFRDVMVADPLIDELQDSYSLQAIARRWGFDGKEEEHLRDAAEAYGLDAKKDMWRLPAGHVGEYAAADAELPLKILRRQERVIENDDLWRIYDLESRVLPVVVKMRRRGVRIDVDKLDSIHAWALDREQKALAEVYRLSGVRVAVGDVWRAEEVLRTCDALGIVLGRTEKGQIKADEAELRSHGNPALDAFLAARKVNKLRTTFVQSMRDHMVGDRIHPTFNQLRSTGKHGDEAGARFGRLSGGQPNLQQQPIRNDEFGTMWRSIFLPDEGALFACCDYSQQEPRWLTHYAEAAGCPGGREAAQRYRDDPRTDNHAMMAELTGLPRKNAKELFLGKVYGMGEARLCHALGLPTDFIETGSGRIVEVAGAEGKKIIEQFNRRAPYVDALDQRVRRVAQQRGYIVTAGGRRCRFPAKGTRYDWTHKATNRLVQGSAADQTKHALVAADAAGLKVQLQVHDEIDFSASSPEHAKQLAAVMESVLPCGVPAVVDVEVGPSWGEIEKVT